MIIDPIRAKVSAVIPEIEAELTDWKATTTPKGGAAWSARPTWPEAATTITYTSWRALR